VKVLVDTTIWSLALRRKHPRPKDRVLIDELSELIKELRAVLIGPVRQEVLSGIPDPAKFEEVRQHLVAFDDLSIVEADYEEAARVFNTCRKKGVQGSHIDFLICAVAMRNSAAVFTTDKDFANYAKYLDLDLHKPRKGKNQS
jgi:predicted nucleic acid-binding protein